MEHVLKALLDVYNFFLDLFAMLLIGSGHGGYILDLEREPEKLSQPALWLKYGLNSLMLLECRMSHLNMLDVDGFNVQYTLAVTIGDKDSSKSKSRKKL